MAPDAEKAAPPLSDTASRLPSHAGTGATPVADGSHESHLGLMQTEKKEEEERGMSGGAGAPLKPERSYEPLRKDGTTAGELSRTRSKASRRSSRPGGLSHHSSYGDGFGNLAVSDEEADGRARGGSGSSSAKEEQEEEDEGAAFVVGWDGEDDPMSPRNLHKARKWTVVIIVSLASACVTCTSSLYTSTYDQITVDFHCSRIVATLGLSLFVIGLGLGPMFLSPLSEFYGRRPIYVTSFVFFVIWLIPCAVARNIQTMLIARFLDGLAGSAFLSVAGGTVGDMFSRNELQGPMMIYTASPFIGPEIGPLVGGFINQYANWRWSFYVLIIWSGAMLAALILFVPETYHPVLLKKKAQKLRQETGDERWTCHLEKTDRTISQSIIWSLIRPFQLLLLEPMCLNLCLFSALLLGIVYLFFGAIPLVLTTNHDFSLHEVGLAFLGLFVGMLVGIMTDPYWHSNYQRLVRNREAAGGESGGSEPEYRLPPAIAGAVLVTIGLFWFAWTTYRSVHWILPIIGSGIFGMGTLLVFSGVFTFLVDAYPLYAASALAANSFARSSFAAAFPLFGVQMYKKLGYQWATSLLAFLTLLMLPFPYLFFVYGKRIRGTSRFAKER